MKKNQPFYSFLIAFFLLVVSANKTQAQTITFTGNAAADFAPLGASLQVNQSDATNDIGYSDPGNCGAPTGFDFQHVYMHYDTTNDRLYVGLDLVGLVGDIDNNGSATTVSSGCTETEASATNNAGWDEPIGIALNTNTSGNYDYWIGWPNSAGPYLGFGVYAYLSTNAYPLAGTYVANTPLASPVVVYPYLNDPTKPDVEFYIENYSSIDPDLLMSWMAFSDAGANGEDNVLGSFSMGAPLPTSFTSFTAKKLAQQVNLQWIMDDATEEGAFQIERSGDAVHFYELGHIKPQDISSNTTTYQFDDLNPLEDMNYYRIQYKDVIGNTFYSRIQSVQFHNQIPLVFYSDATRQGGILRGLEVEGYTIQLYNMVGSRIPLNYEITNREMKLSWNDLAAGQYILVAEKSNEKQMIRLTVN